MLVELEDRSVLVGSWRYTDGESRVMDDRGSSGWAVVRDIVVKRRRLTRC